MASGPLASLLDSASWHFQAKTVSAAGKEMERGLPLGLLISLIPLFCDI